MEDHTTPESLLMLSKLLTKQSGSHLHDSQVHAYDAVGYPVYHHNRNGSILKRCAIGEGTVQRTHHWSPLSDEVEFVQTTKDIKMYGFQMKQVDRYTLTDKVGDELKINVDIVQTAPKQTLTFAEEGVEYALESLSMSAQGTVVLNLNALEGSAKAQGQSAEVLTVKTVEGTEKIELNTAMQLETRVRHEASKKKAAELEDAAKKGATGQEQ